MQSFCGRTRRHRQASQTKPNERSTNKQRSGCPCSPSALMAPSPKQDWLARKLQHETTRTFQQRGFRRPKKQPPSSHVIEDSYPIRHLPTHTQSHARAHWRRNRSRSRRPGATLPLSLITFDQKSLDEMQGNSRPPPRWSAVHGRGVVHMGSQIVWGSSWGCPTKE